MMMARWLPLFLFATSLACTRTPATRGRYLYEVTCDGRVERFDTVEKKKTATFDLAKQPGAGGVVPFTEGMIEVCLAKDTKYDPAKSVFYTLTPTSLRAGPDATYSWRMLTFSVPELALVAQAPAGENLDNPPALQFEGGSVRVIPPEGPWPADMDLSAFAPDHGQIFNRTLEWSGTRYLLRLSERGGPTLAVADRASKSLARLNPPVNLDEVRVHLSPGGTHVLVEAMAQPVQYAPVTGKLTLYDSGTGQVVKQLDEPSIAGFYFHGMAPTGVALYQLPGRDDELVELGVVFPPEQVIVAALDDDFPPPASFFAEF